MSILIGYRDAIDMLEELVVSGRFLLANRPISKNAHDQWEILAANYLKIIYGPKSDEDEAVFHHKYAHVVSYIDINEIKMEEMRADELERQISALRAHIQALRRHSILTEKDGGVDLKIQFSNNRIFIVHGHDDGAKYQVTRFVEIQGLEPIILHEMPNQGRTIIEKFEDYSDVGFAIVLITADDRGGSSKSYDLQYRARQNVIFELGYFLGKLGRKRVCALYEDGVEIPSDYSGVIYIPYDRLSGWKITLAKELREAGFSIDLNKG